MAFACLKRSDQLKFGTNSSIWGCGALVLVIEMLPQPDEDATDEADQNADVVIEGVEHLETVSRNGAMDGFKQEGKWRYGYSGNTCIESFPEHDDRDCGK